MCTSTRLLAAVGLRHRATADVGAFLDVGERGLHTPTISTLSVSFKVTLGAIFPFTVTVLPSTFSIVPATRCVGGCCADAVESRQ